MSQLRSTWRQRAEITAVFLLVMIFGDDLAVGGDGWRRFRRLFGAKDLPRSDDHVSTPIEAQPPLEVISPTCSVAGDPPERTGRNWRVP
jgi:hypothetical protein